MLIGAILTVSTLLASSSFSVFAQTNDATLDTLITNKPTRWYTETDKSLVKIISNTATTVTVEAPIAKKDGKDIVSYYISWSPLSFQDITTTANSDDLKKVKDTNDIKLPDGSPVYLLTWGKLLMILEVLEPTKDLYVTIEPQDENQKAWIWIEDLKLNVNTTTTATTAVAGDSYNSSSNEAINNVTCVWDATGNRTTLLWDINTAMNATKVEISHRPDENQGPMTVKGTPDATARRFVVDTPHRNIQLFRLKPLDANGAMVGIEIQYICKPDNVAIPAPITPTDPKKPIPVTPHTGPLETTAIIFFISLLGYFVYRKAKS